jgi:cob(I)alamin adenosyltransferase
MASNPGEWYAEKAAEAERLAHELAGARAVFQAMHGSAYTTRGLLLETARTVVRRLERQLEQARDVGD